MAIPHYVNENKSDIWSIKPGWYAMDDRGTQPTNGSTSAKLRLTAEVKPFVPTFDQR